MALSSTAKIAVFVLTIASLVLTVIVYSDRQVFLIKVSPSIDPATGQGLVDGPTVLINAFGMKFTIKFVYLLLRSTLIIIAVV